MGQPPRAVAAGGATGEAGRGLAGSGPGGQVCLLRFGRVSWQMERDWVNVIGAIPAIAALTGRFHCTSRNLVSSIRRGSASLPHLGVEAQPLS